MVGHKNWQKQTWQYPQPHDFTFGFGLSMDETMAAKQSTIVPYIFQDNALVDYELVKSNPENADFAVETRPNVRAGSFIPRVQVSWYCYLRGSEPPVLSYRTMPIHTSMLNRLEAFDKKTGDTIEDLLDLQHETTDEQCGALYNTTKLFEGHMVNDLSTDVPFLTTNGQLEGVTFDLEKFFDALHYYTNKEMLRQVSGRMSSRTLAGQLSDSIALKDKIHWRNYDAQVSMCKFQQPYCFVGELFHLPLRGTQYQAGTASVTAIEHFTVLGRVRFNEFNPDFNFARA